MRALLRATLVAGEGLALVGIVAAATFRLVTEPGSADVVLVHIMLATIALELLLLGAKASTWLDNMHERRMHELEVERRKCERATEALRAERAAIEALARRREVH